MTDKTNPKELTQAERLYNTHKNKSFDELYFLNNVELVQPFPSHSSLCRVEFSDGTALVNYNNKEWGVALSTEDLQLIEHREFFKSKYYSNTNRPRFKIYVDLTYMTKKDADYYITNCLLYTSPSPRDS